MGRSPGKGIDFSGFEVHAPEASSVASGRGLMRRIVRALRPASREADE